jgi:hypothetical protein
MNDRIGLTLFCPHLILFREYTSEHPYLDVTIKASFDR